MQQESRSFWGKNKYSWSMRIFLEKFIKSYKYIWKSQNFAKIQIFVHLFQFFEKLVSCNLFSHFFIWQKIEFFISKRLFLLRLKDFLLPQEDFCIASRGFSSCLKRNGLESRGKSSWANAKIFLNQQDFLLEARG